MYSVFRETEWICPLKPYQGKKKTKPLFHVSANIQDFLLVCFWDSFLSSYIVSCPTVLDTFRTRKIISDGRHCNTEHCLLPAYISFLLMINHNSVLNDSGCHSVQEATKVTLCLNQQILTPNASLINRFQFKKAVQSPFTERQNGCGWKIPLEII